MHSFFSLIDRNKHVGVLLLRLFVGLRLVYGVWDNILHWEHMLVFREFLVSFHFPLPLISAHLSAYAQFVAGLLFILGWKIRYAALLMVLNFMIALLMVHRHDTFEAMTPALAMLFSSLLFLFQGAGKFSLDFRKLKKLMEK